MWALNCPPPQRANDRYRNQAVGRHPTDLGRERTIYIRNPPDGCTTGAGAAGASGRTWAGLAGATGRVDGQDAGLIVCRICRTHRSCADGSPPMCLTRAMSQKGGEQT